MVTRAFAACLALAFLCSPILGGEAKVEMDKSAVVKEPEKDADKGVWRYMVESEFLKGSNAVEVLLPDSFDKSRRYRVLYVLPVERGIGGVFGDGLQELRKADVHNKHDLICVAMAFDTVPWFGAHATDPKIRHEDHIKRVVVPLIESRCPTFGTSEGRLLLGFSKSGWGAFSLILRDPDFFGCAVSWDAPLMVEWPGNWGIAEHFGTKENFDKYRISGLFETQAKSFKDKTRLVLLGEKLFGSTGCPGGKNHTEWAHERMTALGIRHVYRNDLKVEHSWKAGKDPDKGWEKPAVEALMALAGKAEVRR